MTTWAALKTMIGDTIWRPETPDAVLDRYALRALKEIMAEREWHWKREIRKADVPAGSTCFDVPTDLGDIESLTVNFNGVWVPVNQSPLHVIRSLWASNTTGTPQDYAYHNGEIIFGPAIDKDYTFEMIYQVSDAPNGDAWTNWITINHPTIVAALAAGYLMLEYYHDEAASSRFFTSYQRGLQKLEDMDDRHNRDHHSGMVKPDKALDVMAFGNRRFFGKG